MKRRYQFGILLLLFPLLFSKISTAFAHPADTYAHTIHVTLASDDVLFDWEIKPGPLLITFVWFQADLDKDNTVSLDEAQNWAEVRASVFTAILEHERLPLQLEGVQFPSTLAALLSGAETIKLQLSGLWPQQLGDTYELVLYNGMEESQSVNWYYVTAQDNLKFPTPEQRNNLLTLEILEPAAQASSQHPLRTEWDSSMPSLPQHSQPSEPTLPGLSDLIPQEQNSSQRMLLDLVRREEFSIAFYIFALGISLALGALHALTPGHGKTVVAAYLVGSRGTSWHALALGTVVTLTHTGSVFLLGIITLLASRYILPTTLIPVFEIISGLLILGLGFYLLWQRYAHWRNARKSALRNTSRKFSIQPSSGKVSSGPYQIRRADSEHGHSHQHNHRLVRRGAEEHMHDHGDGHRHSHEIPESITWRSLIALGISGGLVPCPDAIAILLVAIAINRIPLGLALIVSFSFGLAAVLIVVGLLMVNSRRLFERVGVFDKLAPVLPMVSALVVLALGAVLTTGAFVRVKDEFSIGGTGPSSVSEAQIIYLAGGQEQVKQLFVSKLSDGSPVLLSGESENVVEYALSPDQTKVIYVTRSENGDNQFWLLDLESRERTKLLDCAEAVCSRPAWAPDGNKIIYEYVKFSGKNANQVISPWWMDLNTGEAKSVFPESNFPGANPRWSPDGNWLSYGATETLRLHQLDTGDDRLLETMLPTGADWSPDSQRVLYRNVILQNQQFVTQFFIYELSSGTRTNISPDQGYENLFAAWSPDGRWIASIRRDLAVPRGDQLWLMRADGSEARALTDQPDQLHGSLTWSPDSRFLLYDVQFTDSSSLESYIQIIEVDSGKITDLKLKGYDATWLAP